MNDTDLNNTNVILKLILGNAMIKKTIPNDELTFSSICNKVLIFFSVKITTNDEFSLTYKDNGRFLYEVFAYIFKN